MKVFATVSEYLELAGKYLKKKLKANKIKEIVEYQNCKQRADLIKK